MPKITFEIKSIITCPYCVYEKEETMPVNACLYFYKCESCHKIIKPLKKDCCVFCSYGNVKCPPVQTENSCCDTSL